MKRHDNKTKEQLTKELAEMRQRIAELEASEAGRKQAEEALRKSERRFRDVTENTLEWIWEVDASGKYTYASPVCEKIQGYKPEELLKKHFYDLFAPEEREQLRKTAFEVFMKKQLFRGFVNRNVHKNGEIVWLSTSGVPMLDEEGNLLGYRGADLDITERKWAEEELRQSEEKYRGVVENVDVGVCRVTPGAKGDFIEVNPAMSRIFGYSREEFLRMNVSEMYQDPADRKKSADKVCAQGLVKDEELKLRRRDGTPIIVSETSTAVRDEKENIIYIDAILEDITERQRVEEQLQVLVNNTPFGLSLINKKGAYEYLNARFTDIFGYALEDIPTGREWFEKAYPDPEYRQQAVTDWMDDLRKAGIGELRPRTFTVTCKGGATKDILIRPVTLSGGRQLITYEDITEHKKAEAEKLELEQQAQMVSRLATVGEMASGIAHEINNPLTAVIGYADLVLGRDIPEEVKDDVRIIHEGARRVADIVKRLLAFARQHQPERTYLDINEIIETTLELRAYELETSNIKVTTDLASDLPRTMADAGQLQQMLLNLIINAETEMRLAHGGGKLLVKTETVDSAIRISFRDDGPGISKENLEKIFNPFFTTREVGQGTGLGLSLCHGIIAEHKGQIYAESKPGKGATFIVELSVITEEKQLEMAGAAEEVKEVASARILVVDDESAICQFLERVLTGEGHEVETVADAGDALKKIKKDRYHLILLDIKLPGRSGIELYKRMQKIAKSLARRVVFITGDVMGTDTRAFLSRSGAPYITKPFDVEQLKEEINRRLAGGA